MRYGISAAALLVQNERVLLVNHMESGRYDFWVPPGGRVEGNESIFDCARRETLEETGLSVEPRHIYYIQELVEPDYHFVKFFILCESFSGKLTLANKEQGEDFLVEARFFSREELRAVTVHPEIMKEQFWDDLRADTLLTKYLGLEQIRY
ncbi:MAG: NUDIX domain-containing protein [Chloroflexota bacterium]